MDILNSDDSDRDANYYPDEDLEDLLSSEEDRPDQKKKKRKTGKKDKTTLGYEGTTNEFNDQTMPEEGNLDQAVPVVKVGNLNEVVGQPNHYEGTNKEIVTKRGTIRKRGLKGESRKARRERKELRNRGQEYKTKKGETVKSRKSESLGPCRNKCSEKVPDYVREKLFEEYWGMSNYNRRYSYIASLVQLEEPKRRRVWSENENNHFRLVSIKYNIEIHGTKVLVCKGCFVKIFGEPKNGRKRCTEKKSFF